MLRTIGNLGEDSSPLRQRLADGAFNTIRMCEVRDGGVAGVSPAEGGAPAIVAPARGKAFPQCPRPAQPLIEPTTREFGVVSMTPTGDQNRQHFEKRCSQCLVPRNAGAFRCQQV